MPARPPRLPWERPGWREQADVWIGAALGRVGLVVSGPIERVSLSRWSLVLRAPTTGWSATRPRLLAALEAAHRVGMIGNALTWRHVLAPFGRSRASDVDEPAPRLLREFLAAERASDDVPSAPAT